MNYLPLAQDLCTKVLIVSSFPSHPLKTFPDKREWNIRRHLESTAFRADSPDSQQGVGSSSASVSTTTTTTTTVTTTPAQPPATLVRQCLKAALDQVKSAVLKQENELVNQPAHILALIDQQMDLFLKCHFQGTCMEMRTVFHAPTHLYKRVRPSVRRSVTPSKKRDTGVSYSLYWPCYFERVPWRNVME